MQDRQAQEQAAHLHSLRGFARQIGVPEDAAAAAYIHELTILGADATIKRYVGLIAEKRARDALRRGARKPATA